MKETARPDDEMFDYREQRKVHVHDKKARVITIDDNLIFTAGKIRKLNYHETYDIPHLFC